MSKDNSLYLKHIQEAISKIEEYLSGHDFNSFKKDSKTFDATVRELEIIGEAINNLDEEFRRTNPQIPFRDAIDMRNLLIHEYFGVDEKTVWDTCVTDLKDLKVTINEILK